MKKYYFDIPVSAKEIDTLDDIELPHSIDSDDLNRLESEINNAGLGNYTKYGYLINSEIKDNKIYFVVIASKKIGKRRIKEIEEFLTGQCSDGWGENGFDFRNHGENIHISVWEDVGDKCNYVGEQL